MCARAISRMRIFELAVQYLRSAASARIRTVCMRAWVVRMCRMTCLRACACWWCRHFACVRVFVRLCVVVVLLVVAGEYFEHGCVCAKSSQFAGGDADAFFWFFCSCCFQYTCSRRAQATIITPSHLRSGARATQQRSSNCKSVGRSARVQKCESSRDWTSNKAS